MILAREMYNLTFEKHKEAYTSLLNKVVAEITARASHGHFQLSIPINIVPQELYQRLIIQLESNGYSVTRIAGKSARVSVGGEGKIKSLEKEDDTLIIKWSNF